MTGQIVVKKLYGLDKVTYLVQLVYKETINALEDSKVVAQKYAPCIESIVLSRAERNFNIFFVKNDDSHSVFGGNDQKETKEIICFDASKVAVWQQLDGFGLAN